MGCTALNKLTLSKKLKSTGSAAFANCQSLVSVTIPYGVENIESGAFNTCLSLKNVTIPSTVRVIGNGAFSNCKAMSNITIPGSVTEIGSSAFEFCESLKSVIIPKSVRSIGSRAFGYTMDIKGNQSRIGGFTIYCYKGTEGEKYAKNNSIAYKLLDGGTTEKQSVASADVKLSSTKLAYTGESRTPNVTVKVGGKTLTNGPDYILYYKNTRNPGKATVTVVGIGKYTGQKTLSYYIVPKRAAITKVTSAGKKKLTIKWKKDTKADGYQVQLSLKKNFSKIARSLYFKKNTSVSTTVTGLTSGKKYYVRVRAYKNVDGKKKYGSFSTVKYANVK